MEKNYKILDFKSKGRAEATKEEYLLALESAYGLDTPEELLKRTLKAIGDDTLRTTMKAFFVENLLSFSLSIGISKEENLLRDTIDRYLGRGVYNGRGCDYTLGEKLFGKVERYIDDIKYASDLRNFAKKSEGFMDIIKTKVSEPTKNYFLLKQLLALHPDKNFDTKVETTTLSNESIQFDTNKELKALPDTFSGIAKVFCDFLLQKNITGGTKRKEHAKYQKTMKSLNAGYAKDIQKADSQSGLSDAEKEKIKSELREKHKEDIEKAYREFDKKSEEAETKLREYKEKIGLNEESLRTSKIMQGNLSKTKMQAIKGIFKSLNPNNQKTSCKSISHDEFNPYNYEKDQRFVVDFEGRVQDAGLNKKLKKIIESILGDVEIRSTERTFSRPSRCAHFIKNAFLPVYKKNKPRKKPLFFIDSSGSMYLSEHQREKQGIPFNSKTAMIAAFLRDNNRKISELHPKYFHFNSCPAEEFNIKDLLPTANGGNNMLFLKAMQDKCANIVFTDGGFDTSDYGVLKRWVEKHPNMDVHWICNDRDMISVLKEACGKYKTHQVHYCAF